MIREFCVVGLSGVVLSSAVAGDLNPPPGPVVPSMKTLDEVEPRTAVNAQNTPGSADAIFVIDEPGSYYLTGNVQGQAGMSGIMINSDFVTLDLNGFRLAGVNGSESGIEVSLNGGFARGVTIRNGSIRNWDDSGISYLADYGLIEGIFFENCGPWALSAGQGFSIRVKECRAANCGDDAATGMNDGDFLLADAAIVTGCFSRESDGVSFRTVSTSGTIQFVDCMSTDPTSAGFAIPSEASSFVNCTVSLAGTVGQEDSGFLVTGDSATFENCSASRSTGPDFAVESSALSMSNCTSERASLDGFLISSGPNQEDSSASLIGCSVSSAGGNGFVITTQAASVIGCTAEGNGQSGFLWGIDSTSIPDGSVVFENCSATRNGGDGFTMFDDVLMRGCVAGGNTGAGSFAVRSFQMLSADGCSFGSGNAGSISIGSGSFIRNCDFDFGCPTPVGIVVTGRNAQIVGNKFFQSCTLLSGVGVSVQSTDTVIDGNIFQRFQRAIELTASSADCHIMRNFFNNSNPIFDSGTSNVVTPVLNDTTVMTATNPFANWDD